LVSGAYNEGVERTPSRQPVQARSIATRAALLDAAVECLCADGYAAVTTTEIARRAGVSRGAQLHHFPTKAELLAAAVEHLLQRRMREFAEVLADVAPRLDQLDVAVDVVWTMFQGPAFIAWVELWVAARTDPDLAATMADVDRRFTDESRLMFVEMGSGIGPNDPRQLELARDFAFAVMTGVALQRLVPRGQRPASELLDILKAVARSMMIEQPATRAT
jgi:AcrR family transcriptional regulator